MTIAVAREEGEVEVEEGDEEGRLRGDTSTEMTEQEAGPLPRQPTIVTIETDMRTEVRTEKDTTAEVTTETELREDLRLLHMTESIGDQGHLLYTGDLLPETWTEIIQGEERVLDQEDLLETVIQQGGLPEDP